ncbi:MAG TPA: chemotaxis protein CheB [Gaiellaceae bacterium]|jgi:two-component system chemotaxis response regulator CheB
MAGRTSGFDVGVVGASAGGVEALLALVRELPEDFAAALFVVLHVPPTGTSVLPRILTRAGKLEAAHAVDGEPIEPGRIYVAPPDCHLLIDPGAIRVSRGPRENGHRPAIDPLFRTAARAYGTAVAAIVLSGTMDDGAAGLKAVQEAGGITLVQDPEEALYPGMPRNAIELTRPDHVLPIRELARTLAELARLPSQRPSDSPVEPDRAEGAFTGTREDQWPGDRAPFACPACGGTLWESDEDGEPRFLCRVGHAFTETALANSQSDGLEVALWSALRALEERTALTRRIAARLQRQRKPSIAARYELQAEDAEAHSVMLRDVLANLGALNHLDPAEEMEAEAR